MTRSKLTDELLTRNLVHLAGLGFIPLALAGQTGMAVINFICVLGALAALTPNCLPQLKKHGYGFDFEAASYFAGIYLLLFFAPLNIALPSIAVFCAVDGVAAIAGSAWGKHPLPSLCAKGKTWEGTCGGVLAGMIALLPFMPTGNALAVSIGVATAEAIWYGGGENIATLATAVMWIGVMGWGLV